MGPVTRMSFLNFIFFLVIIGGFYSEQAQDFKTATPLRLNEPVQRSIDFNENHSYRIDLQAGDFLQVGLEQKRINVSLWLFSPHGQKLFGRTGLRDFLESKELFFIAQETGPHFLQVNPNQGPTLKKPNTYQIKIVAIGEPKEIDRLKYQGLEAFNSALTLGLTQKCEMENTQAHENRETHLYAA